MAPAPLPPPPRLGRASEIVTLLQCNSVTLTRTQRIAPRSEKILRNSSKSDSGRDLRAMQDHVENEMIVLEVRGQSAITELGKDVPGEVDAQNAFDLPHQVRTYTEPSDLAAHGGVKRFVKIVPGMQSDIGIEPAIISRDRLVQLGVEGRGELVRDLGLDRANDSLNGGATRFAL